MFIKLLSVACTTNVVMIVKVLCKLQRTFTIVNLPLGGAMTLSITTFSLMTLRNDTQQDNTHHNGIEFSYAQCSYTECHI